MRPQRLARELGRHAALVEHDDAVAQRRELVDVGRADQHRRAGGGGRADQRVHLVLGADVDAARRVVEQEHRRLRRRATWRTRPSAGCRPTATRRPDRPSGCGSADRRRARARAPRSAPLRTQQRRRRPARPSGPGRCSPRSACRASARAGWRSPGTQRDAGARSRAADRCGTGSPSGSTTVPRRDAGSPLTSSSTA